MHVCAYMYLPTALLAQDIFPLLIYNFNCLSIHKTQIIQCTYTHTMMLTYIHYFSITRFFLREREFWLKGNSPTALERFCNQQRKCLSVQLSNFDFAKETTTYVRTN